MTVILHARTFPPCWRLRKVFLKRLEAQEGSCLALHQIIQEVLVTPSLDPSPGWAESSKLRDRMAGNAPDRKVWACTEAGRWGVWSIPRDPHRNSLSLCWRNYRKGGGGGCCVYLDLTLIRICFIIRKITLHEHGNLSADIAAMRGEQGMSLMYRSCLFRAEVPRLQE